MCVCILFRVSPHSVLDQVKRRLVYTIYIYLSIRRARPRRGDVVQRYVAWDSDLYRVAGHTPSVRLQSIGFLLSVLSVYNTQSTQTHNVRVCVCV